MTECAHGAQCSGFERSSGRAMEIERGPLCSGCLRRASADIASLPRDYVDLAQALVPGRSATEAHVTCGESDAPVPLDLGVDALMRLMRATLVEWETPVRIVARLAPVRRVGVRDGWAVARAVEVLAPRVDILAGLPPMWSRAGGPEHAELVGGVAGVGALRALHRRARVVLGRTRLVHELPGECSGCGCAALRRADGSDTVSCAVCQRRWTYDDYRRYVSMILEVRA